MDAAVGGLSISKAALQSQLSKCARFQAFASNTAVPLSEANALLRVHLDGHPFPTDENGNIKEEYTDTELAGIRPFAMIFSDPRLGYTLQAVGAPTACVESGKLYIHFEKDIPEALWKTPDAVNRLWDNDMGVIMRQLMDLKTTDGMLQIDNNIQVNGPIFSREAQIVAQGNFCYALMTVTWGGGS